MRTRAILTSVSRAAFFSLLYGIVATARAQPPLVNADFSSGLDGWSTAVYGAGEMPGGVTVEDGQAVLREGDAFEVQLYQSFSIPRNATVLSFDVVLIPGFDHTATFIPDAFEIHLLGQSGASVLPAWKSTATACLNFQEDGTVHTGAATTWDGTRVTLNVRDVAADTAATLLFSLIGSDSDTGTSLRVDNVVVAYDNQPPVCDAGGPYSAECQGSATTVPLDGTGSADPNEDPLTYWWSTERPGVEFDDPNSPTPTLTVTAEMPCELSFDVLLTVSDGLAPPVECLTTVTIEDTEPPMIACPANVSVECGTAADPAQTGVPAVTDMCDPAPQVSYEDAVEAGAILRNWTATDACGQSASCVQAITLLDTTPPTIECPADLTINADAEQCAATNVNLGNPATEDACGVASVTNDAPPQLNVGATAVTWTVTDTAGLTATCVQTVTVVDTQPPTITCPADVVVYTSPGQGASSVALGDPTTNDNCGVASVANDAPAAFPIGRTTVTWTATDAAGLNATCTQYVTVIDSHPPVARCRNAQVSGKLLQASDIDAGSYDPDGAEDVLALCITAVDGTTVNCAGTVELPSYGTHTVTLTILDHHGLSDRCTAQVIARDVQAPLLACPGFVLLQTTSTTGMPAGDVPLSAAALDDSGGPVTITDNRPAATYPVGDTIVTFTATDAAGNQSTCRTTVSVVQVEPGSSVQPGPCEDDKTPPEIVCLGRIEVLSETDVPVGDVTLQVAATDNCDPSVTVVDDRPSTSYAFQSGDENVTVVTFTAIDTTGNSATCQTEVVIVDPQTRQTTPTTTETREYVDQRTTRTELVPLWDPASCGLLGLTPLAFCLMGVGAMKVGLRVRRGRDNIGSDDSN